MERALELGRREGGEEGQFAPGPRGLRGLITEDF